MSEDDFNRITGYLTGELSSGEIAATERWIGEDAEREKLVLRLRSSRETLKGAWRERFDLDRAVQSVGQRIGMPLGTPSDSSRLTETRAIPRAAGLRYRGGLRKAQVLRWALGATATALTMWIAISGVRRSTSPGTPARYATTLGQRALLTLRDGSHVILGPQSTLVIASDFGANTRGVTLRGEAYFDVTAAVHAPFVVTTDGITTRVLGTAFNLRHYPGDEAVQVFVRTGKVMTTGPKSAATVTAGRGAYVTDSTVRVTGIPELGQYTDLATEQLVFNDTPVPELLAALGRWYGYDFRLTDSTLAAEHVSATIKASDAAEMLKVLKAVLNVSLKFDGTVVRLVPHHNGPRERRSLLDAPAPARVDNNPLTMEIGR